MVIWSVNIIEQDLGASAGADLVLIDFIHGRLDDSEERHIIESFVSNPPLVAQVIKNFILCVNFLFNSVVRNDIGPVAAMSCRIMPLLLGEGLFKDGYRCHSNVIHINTRSPRNFKLQVSVLEHRSQLEVTWPAPHE